MPNVIESQPDYAFWCFLHASPAPKFAGLSGESFGCPGKVSGESINRSACPAESRDSLLFSGCRDSEKERDMRFSPTIFGQLLEPKGEFRRSGICSVSATIDIDRSILDVLYLVPHRNQPSSSPDTVA